MIHKGLLIALIVACTSAASIAATQESGTAPRQSFTQVLQAAERARNENHDDAAIALFQRALSQQPDSQEALWYLGTVFYEKGQFGDARDVLRQFMTIRPDAGPGWALLGLSEFQLREYRRALRHLQRAMAVGIEDRKELVQLVFYEDAILLTRFEHYDDSMDMLLKMIASDARDPLLIEPAGLAGLRLPLLPSEIPADRRELVGLAGRAVLAMQTQHYEEANSEFKQLTAAYPSEPGVHFLYGAYLAQLHPNQAEREFERELEVSPSHVLARVRLADEVIAQRNFDRALTLAEQAVKLDPKRASPHMLAGEALIGKGNATEGIRQLEIARADDASIARIHWDLLRAYANAGRKEEVQREKLEIERLYNNKNSSHRFADAGDTRHDQTSPIIEH